MPVALATNWALGGRAKQSSTVNVVGRNAGLYDASNAIDGNADGNIKHGSCTLTKVEHKSWWKVIFKELVVVKEVTITTSVSNGKFLIYVATLSCIVSKTFAYRDVTGGYKYFTTTLKICEYGAEYITWQHGIG